ncbi:MAG: ABC transporter permease [Saprospiraceae bacterium]
MNWLLKMAWRDSRRNRSRLVLFISSIVIGIAALVAINSFSENLQKDINREAQTLLGADLVLEGSQPVNAEMGTLFDSISAQQTDLMNFTSMVYFSTAQQTRLCQITAIEGDFPFYGKINTLPETAYKTYQTGQNAMLDKSLMVQFNIQEGDSVKIGDLHFTVAGSIISSPGRAGIGSSIAPLVYIPMAYLEKTGLIQNGSRVEYQYYFLLKEGIQPDSLVKDLRPRFQEASLRPATVQSRKAGIGRAFASMTDFLNLVGFIALILGCIGVASAVHIYIKDKLATVAILRCMGVSGWQALWIYLIQIVVMGFIGSIIGAALGSLLQVSLPIVLGDFLPLQNVSSDISFSAITSGVFTGLGIAILFAMLPLLAIRKTSPLRTLRTAVAEEENQRDILKWVVYLLIALFIGGFAYAQMGNFISAIIFIVAIFAAFLLLAGTAKLATWGLRKFFPTRWSYVWRQSIANLYRPNNQTLILIVSLGLGTALISTLFFIQGLLLNQVALTGSGDQPNMIIFDIQSEQKAGVAKLVKDFELPLLQQVPVVTMRVDNINGITKAQNIQDTSIHMRRWVFDREYRVTYRDSLTDTEEVIEGEWHGNKATSNDETIYVSLSDRIAKSMKAEIGMKITFNVQGALIDTEVSSIREVDFSQMQPNFFVVFPSGVLEKAPQFNVVVSKVDSPEKSASFQQALVQQFPNVSAIDLSQILKTVDDILTKVSFVIRFMALFSILTGLLVLISSVVLSKFQRMQESVLLRTLGANRSQVLWINALEYFLLGALSAITGIALSVIGSWALATFTFKIPFQPDLVAPLLLFISITALTVIIGLFNSRSVLSRPPLEVLRSEL